MTKNVKVKPRKPSGFGEFLPNEQIAFNRLVDIIRESYELYGFVPIETPAVELTEVLLAKGGGETDKQIYRFSKGDTDLSLHFDLTIPLARYVAEHYSQLTFPFRRYQIQKVWRAERAQKGRFREFLQCDVDVIGSNSLFVDAEMISLVSSVFEKMKIGDFVVKINNRKLLTGFFEFLGLSSSSADILRIIDKLEKIGKEAVRVELKSLGIEREKIEEVLDFILITGSNEDILTKLSGLHIKNPLFAEGISDLQTVMDVLALSDISPNRYQIDLTIARGLDYYTGIIYETLLIGYPELGSIASGGRYDNLASYYTKETLSGVGISIGLTRLFSKLKELGLIETKTSSSSKVLVSQLDTNLLGQYIKLAENFRKVGIPSEVYPVKDKLKKQLEYANKLGISYVVLIGEEEVKKNQISLKNMHTGEQITLGVNEGIEIVRNNPL